MIVTDVVAFAMKTNIILLFSDSLESTLLEWHSPVRAIRKPK